MGFYNFLDALLAFDASSSNYLAADDEIPWAATSVRFEQQTFTTTQHKNTSNPFTNAPSSSGTQIVNRNDSTPSTIFYRTQGPETPAHQIIQTCEPPHCTPLGEPKKPPSDLYLCGNCYNAIQSFVRREADIHLCPNASDICFGTHKVPTTTNATTRDPSASTRRHSPGLERVTNHRSATTRNKTREERHSRTRRTALSTDTKFYCSVATCNCGTNDIGSTWKDNRNVHERSVHDIGAARSPVG